MEKIEIKKTRNGFGIFTTKKFNQGDIILEIKGKLISCDEDSDIDERTRSNTIRFDEEKYISPAGEVADFLNHSCEPNSAIVKQNRKLFIVAVLNFKKGEEVLIDYSTILASDDSWRMKCNCGAKKCRKIVRKFNTLPKTTQQRYINLNMVPDYILDK